MSKVLIGVATFKRPQMLMRLLRAIEQFETDADVRVLVADNDSVGRDGVAVVEELVSKGFRFPLSSLVVEMRGFTYGRNALLEHGFADPLVDFVAIVDDDQWPEPAWLDELLKVQRETNADVVGAAVWAEFEVRPPQWALKSGVYAFDTTTTGHVDVLHGDGGVLISRNVTALLVPPWYDHHFAMSGGADEDLFLRLRAAGARFARAAGAVIHETFPASRITLRWALARAYRTGNCEMRRVILRSGSIAHVIKESAKILAAFILAPFAFLLFLWSPGRRVDALCKLWRAAGKVAALQGSRYEEYATIHGR